MKCGTARQFMPFDDDHILPSHLCEMVGDTRPAHPTSDNDCLRMCWKFHCCAPIYENYVTLRERGLRLKSLFYDFETFAGAEGDIRSELNISSTTRPSQARCKDGLIGAVVGNNP